MSEQYPKIINSYESSIIISASVEFGNINEYLDNCSELKQYGMVGVDITHATFKKMLDLVKDLKDRMLCVFVHKDNIYQTVFITLEYLANPSKITIPSYYLDRNGMIRNNVTFVYPNVCYKWKCIKNIKPLNLRFHFSISSTQKIYDKIFACVTPAAEKMFRKYKVKIVDQGYVQYRIQRCTQSEQIIGDI